METLNNSYRATTLTGNKKIYLLTEEVKTKDIAQNKKIETLLSQKFSLEMLLNLIKQLQYNYISKNSLTKDNKNKKEKLIELKDILSNILDRKSKIYNSNKKEIEEKKDKINKKILLDSEEDNNCVNYAKELEQLRINEFNMENEIKKFDNEIKEKSMLNNYESEYLEKSSNKKIFYDQHKKNELSSLEILREEKKDIQQQLIDLTIKKSEQESEINSIKMKISIIKNKLKEKKVEKFEISQDCSDNKDYKIVKRNNNKRIKWFNEDFKLMFQKWEDYFINSNNCGSESSNKETNFSSVKNYGLNVDKYENEPNNNFNYLNNHIIFDIDNNKSLNSFNSSLDSDF
jgi:hypothetical protein